MIFTVPNAISLLRLPLAILFFADSLFLKTLAIVLAMITDGLDGFLARKFQVTSKLGTILDPLMDKFFVGVLLIYFFLHGQIALWEVLAFLARDITLLFFGIYLLVQRLWSRFTIRAIWNGKIFTAIQLVILLSLTYGFQVPAAIFCGLIVLGVFAFIELYVAAAELKGRKDKGQGH